MGYTCLGSLRSLLYQDGKLLPVEEITRRVIESCCRWILVTFRDLQDCLLALGMFRSLVIYALGPSFRGAVLRGLRLRKDIHESFAESKYFVNDDAKQLLIHASLFSIHWNRETHGKYTERLPSVGRILLQAPSKKSGKFQEAVASALAKEVNASLFVVDEPFLLGLAKELLGGELDSSDLSDGSGSGLTSLLLSLWLSGGRIAFLWDLIRHHCSEVEGPLILFVRDVEEVICGSYERYDAFVGAFGSRDKHPLGSSSNNPSNSSVVLMGGCSLGETGTQLTERSSASDGEKATGVEKKATSSGLDDAFSTLLDINLSTPERSPNPRSVLPRLFATKVKLQAPPGGPAAVKHHKQLLEDATRLTAETNFQRLSHIAADRRIRVPPVSHSIYTQRAISDSDWAKILSWAVSMELLAKQKKAKAPLTTCCAKGKQATAVDETLPLLHVETPQLGEDYLVLESKTTATPESAYRGEQPVSTTGKAAAQVSPVSHHTEIDTDDTDLSGDDDLENSVAGDSLSQDESEADVILIERPAEQQHSKARLDDSTMSMAAQGRSRDAISNPLLVPESELDVRQKVDQSMDQKVGVKALQAQAESKRIVSRQASSKASAGKERSNHMQSVLKKRLEGSGVEHQRRKTPVITVSEEALWYGMKMLERSGNGIRAQIKADNAYERRLLSEVISPDEAGVGFSEVGALDTAKTALREAVQLPLQYPHLFMKGSLSRPCKGVLLFGPPGTGKTLLARAAAAECGASFLAVSPSTVASKWLGDGVRYVRAVFSLASKLAPCVIFIDEVDALLGRRKRTEHEALREMKNEFMAQWDGIRAAGVDPSERVMVLGATNRPHDLDEAVLRRFSRRIFCSLPDRSARIEVLKVILSAESLCDDVDVMRLADRCAGFSGSDLKQLCSAAAMRPVRELLKATGKSAMAQKGRGNGDQAFAIEPRTDKFSELLDECTAMATVSQTRCELRPLAMMDFEEALLEVGSTVGEDSIMMQELQQWNEQYGDGGSNSAYKNSKLSYFM